MKIYEIILKTPLGDKCGELAAEIKNGTLRGSISLLGNTEPIEGMVDEQGNCKLKGKLRSLLQTVDFEAEGTINYDALRLSVNGGGSIQEMVGALKNQKW